MCFLSSANLWSFFWGITLDTFDTIAYCRRIMRVSESLAIVGSLQFGLSGPFDCHVYAIRGLGGIVLIDAGAGTHTEKLLQNVDVDLPDGSISGLVITHSHVDHCGGAGSIRQATGCRVIAPFLSRRIIEEGDERGSGLEVARGQGLYPSDFRQSPCKVDTVVCDSDSFSVAGLTFTAIHLRGHSEDTFCYLTCSFGVPWLFCGDALFYGATLGVINSEGSGMDGYRKDLNKLSDLKVEGLFPGHGLFTIRDGQRHIDCAIQQLGRGFLGRQIGQEAALF
jgi:hydroxyacylglutathione hydrolase